MFEKNIKLTDPLKKIISNRFIKLFNRAEITCKYKCVYILNSCSISFIESNGEVEIRLPSKTPYIRPMPYIRRAVQ